MSAAPVGFTNSLLPSRPEQLERIALSLLGYLRLPFASDSIPGAFVEAVIASVRGGRVLRTYDFVDVVDERNRIGWQVKSTKEATPVTWKRAKIPNAPQLISASRESEEGLQALGDAIIDFCNEHARASVNLYGLDAIGYTRVIVTRTQVIYFERELISNRHSDLFNRADFRWQWSVEKNARKKEQLQALHGINVHTNDKWFAWHGLGENQLHFSKERVWWPEPTSPNIVVRPLPTEDAKLTFDVLVSWLASTELAVESQQVRAATEQLLPLGYAQVREHPSVQYRPEPSQEDREDDDLSAE